MKLFDFRFIQPVAVLGGLVGLAGCAQPSSNSYPTSPPEVSSSSGSSSPAASTSPAVLSSSVVKVPPDAIELSHGDYPPPGFPAPGQPGLIMVVDMDGDPNTAVASTAVTGTDAGKQMSITDVANMTITMNKLHKYRVVFVPNKP